MFKKPILILVKTMLVVVVISVCAPQRASAQLLQATNAATPPFTPQNLIENIFLGQGVEVTNITFQGDPVAVGYFTGGQNAIGIERGIVLTTGNAANTPSVFGCDAEGSDFASSSNTGGSTEPDLDNLVTVGLNDVAVFTITFVPTSDTLRFRYCFASEEYPEYACSPYNDVFGFFIQGPGYPVPTNIALIPGTNLPVTINNIHPFNPAYAPCPPTNAQYYNDNNNSNSQPSYDGYTDVFIAEAIVQPCQQYTIKLAIADASDTAFDSGVFLEAKSFGTGSIRTEVSTVSLDGTVTEGCATGSITFSLPVPAAQDIPLDYNIWGSATNGVDYTFVAPNQVIAAGTTSLQIVINAQEDGIPEGTEFIAIDVQRDPCNRDTVYLYIRENALLSPILRPDTTICSGGQPLLIDGTLPIPVPPPFVFTNDTDIPVSPPFTAVFSPINVFGVQPTVLGDGIIRSVCLNITHNWVDDLDLFLISPGGQFIELSTDNGADGNNYTNTCFTPLSNNLISFPGPFAPASAAPFTGEFKPEGVWSDLWGGPVNGLWRLQAVDDQNGFVGTIRDWTLTFEPSYKVNYTWSPAAAVDCPTCPIVNANPTQSTMIRVVATDSYGCMVTDSVYVDVQPSLAAPTVDCGLLTPNSISFEWDTVATSLGYEININGAGWITPQTDTSHTITGLIPNSVMVLEVRGINPIAVCDALVATATCINCAPPVVTHTETSVSCFGASDGTVTFTPDNVNPPYTFRVGTNANGSGVFSGLAAGNYIGTVTDGGGCDTLIPFTIPTPPAIVANVLAQQSVSCFGAADGVLAASATGGTGVLQYIWSDPAAQTTPVATGLPAGAYAVTITDQNGCSLTAPGTIVQPAVLIAQATATATPCFGTPAGTLSGSANGGNSGYQYLWNTGQTGANLSNIPAGVYTLTVTDALSCSATAIATVNQPTQLSVGVLAAPATCSDRLDGTAAATPAGGTSPFTFQWSAPGNPVTPNIANLGAGTYTVTVTDAQLCTAVGTATVVSPPALVVDMTQTPVACNGGNTGTATAGPSGGNGGFTYFWNNPGLPQTTATAVNLPFGTYTVTVTDNKGCSATAAVTVDQEEALLPSTFTLPATCFGRNDGSAKVNVTGGNGPYNYIWSNGQTTSNIDNQLAGIYTVTITDANLCTVATTAFINQPPQIVIALQPTNVLCHNGSSGGISTLVVGGSGSGYSIVWFGPDNFLSTDFNLNLIKAGNYQATVTDGAGCTQVASTTVNQPDAPLSLTAPLVSDTVCFNAATGTAKIFAQGGTTPYNYQWDDPQQQTTQFPVGLSAAVYRVTVTDANGCYRIDSTFIFQKNALFVYITGNRPRCHDGRDGFASIDFVSYGTDPYNPDLINFVWNTEPPQTGRVATNLAVGSYTVTATDDEGCTSTQTVTIENQPELSGFFTQVRNLKCHDDQNAQALINANGGTAPYTYFWSPNVSIQNSQLAENLSAGEYRVTITDARDCQTVSTIQFDNPPPVQTELVAQGVLCFGETTGEARVNATGGADPYSYQWSSGATTRTATGIGAGVHTVTVTDFNGCAAVDSIRTPGPQSPLAGITSVQEVSCFKGSDGRIEITGQGGTPPYRFALDNQPWNGSPLQIGLRAGIYTPRVQDGNGCVTTLPLVTVGQRNAIEIDLGPEITIELGQSTQLMAEVLNAQAPIEIAWSPEDSLWLSCMDCLDPFVDSLWYQNTFELFVVDALGCTGEASIRVVVEKPRRIYVPTGFTPNEDSANDVLMVHGQESARIIDFRVFDRWGELLFQSQDFRPNDASKGWDGAFRGRPMSPDTYVWTLEVEYLDGVREVLYGQTALIR